MTDLVFIHGILQRSGTNFLNKILLLHPNCVQPRLKIREDWFLHFSEPLYQYVKQLLTVWSNPKWGGESFSGTEFLSTIGNALTAYISKDIPDLSDKMLVSKTPSVQHLSRCFQLFPLSKLIIITRDPRDVAASALKTWNRRIEESLHAWELATKTISYFEKQAPQDQYLLIRYEDMVFDKEIWVKKCLRFFGLSEVDFPWDALSNLPVFGSSENKTWRVKPMSQSFCPVGRWRLLPENQRRHFSAMTPSCLRYFGYSETGEDCHQALPSREERLGITISMGDH